MIERPENWVFLGDSLSEGVGSSRVSYITELGSQLRGSGDERGVHVLRLRNVDPAGFNRFIQFNLAGHLNADLRQTHRALWLWNLACEGRTVEADLDWLPLLRNLRPEQVIVHRGSLESIVRPAMVLDGSWPAWVPRSWRGYAAMDPRCYFSTTWWRRTKQTAVNALKQKVRLNLLKRQSGVALMNMDSLIRHYRMLVVRLRELDTSVLLLGLLPIDGVRFPGSAENFERVNARLRELAAEEGAEFFDWGSQIPSGLGREALFYRDGFHPSLEGAQVLAGILRQHLSRVVAG